MRYIVFFVIILTVIACGNSQEKKGDELIPLSDNKDTTVLSYYEKNKGNSEKSKSLGTVSNGKLTNGKLLPFYGKNFSYFDKGSYLDGRAYVNGRVLNTILASYKKLEEVAPNRKFKLMESANREGGKLYPHRTHKNGLSVDFMMPLIKDNKPYYKLDSLGVTHYLLSFNDNGAYNKDTAVTVDFNLMAQHILILNEKAKQEGLKVKKVIIKIEYKDELFATEYGKKLKASGVYVVKGLSKMINALHDEHYHIDFGEL